MADNQEIPGTAIFMCTRMLFFFLGLVSLSALLSCQKPGHPSIASTGYQNQMLATYKESPEQSAVRASIKVVDLRTLADLDAIVPQLAEKRVVFVGEIHDRFDHHLAQLALIRALHALHAELAIGMEYFQTSAQQYLDAYVTGKLDEKTFLQKTQYFERWGFDYRLYRPIMKYARENGIPLVALNLPTELTRKVARFGLDGLSEEEKTQIPSEIDRSDHAYRERLRSVFEQHRRQRVDLANFDFFVEAQLLWDEAMAATAADYLRRNPARRMIILAGNGHLSYGSGIPNRLTRRLPVDSVIVINAGDEVPDPELADFLLYPTKISLAPAGMLGIAMQKRDDRIVIEDLIPGGAAINAGLAKGDQLVEVGGDKVTTLGDVKLALLDKRPHDRITVIVRRSATNSGTRLIDFEVALSAPH